MSAQWYDANVSLPGCDKNMPGSIMAMARLNRPSIMVYGGTIKPGYSQLDGSVLDIVSAFQSFGEATHIDISPYAVLRELAGAGHMTPPTHTHTETHTQTTTTILWQNAATSQRPILHGCSCCISCMLQKLNGPAALQRAHRHMLKHGCPSVSYLVSSACTC
jgi:hypothetical protein